jgi:RNA polymerase sigma-70 factor, ECF subfamily
VLIIGFMAASDEKPLADVIRDFQSQSSHDANFKLLFERYFAQVFRFFQRKGLAPEDCRDLTQEVFLSVYRSLGDLRDARQFPVWLFTIARNAFVNELERKHAGKRRATQVWPQKRTEEPEPADMDAYPSASASALDHVLDAEKRSRLVDALRLLPLQTRRCVQLRIGEENSYEQISAILGISVNTVKAHLHKARRELKDKLAPYFGQVEIE